jgi:hypothetical protein
MSIEVTRSGMGDMDGGGGHANTLLMCVEKNFNYGSQDQYAHS